MVERAIIANMATDLLVKTFPEQIELASVAYKVRDAAHRMRRMKRLLRNNGEYDYDSIPDVKLKACPNRSLMAVRTRGPARLVGRTVLLCFHVGCSKFPMLNEKSCSDHRGALIQLIGDDSSSTSDASQSDDSDDDAIDTHSAVSRALPADYSSFDDILSDAANESAASSGSFVLESTSSRSKRFITGRSPSPTKFSAGLKRRLDDSLDTPRVKKKITHGLSGAGVASGLVTSPFSCDIPNLKETTESIATTPVGKSLVSERECRSSTSSLSRNFSNGRFNFPPSSKKFSAGLKRRLDDSLDTPRVKKKSTHGLSGLGTSPFSRHTHKLKKSTESVATTPVGKSLVSERESSSSLVAKSQLSSHRVESLTTGTKKSVLALPTQKSPFLLEPSVYSEHVRIPEFESPISSRESVIPLSDDSHALGFNSSDDSDLMAAVDRVRPVERDALHDSLKLSVSHGTGRPRNDAEVDTPREREVYQLRKVLESSMI